MRARHTSARLPLALTIVAAVIVAGAGLWLPAMAGSWQEQALAPRSQVMGMDPAKPSPDGPEIEQIRPDLFRGLTDGREIYAAGCTGCHGANLEGGSAQSMIDGVWQFGGNRNQIRRSIANGIVNAGMPAYEQGLTDQQLDAVTDYLLTAERRAAPEPRKLPATIDAGGYRLQADVFADDLDTPWAVCFLSDREAIVTEKAGDLHRIVDGDLQSQPVQGTPRTQVRGQGGMMDVAVDPDYAENGWVYLAYSHPKNGDFGRDADVMTRIVRGRIIDNRWTDEQVLFEAKPEHYRDAGVHFGSRIVFPPDGYLYFSIGDRGAKEMAQDLTRPNGKVHRINRDGSIPADNPFVDVPDAYGSIFTYGNRNPQGLSVHPETGDVWETEHGPLGGDELNLVRPGVNYGWPEISYGRNYDGTIITDDVAREGMAQPRMYWNPSTAVCGMEFYDGKLFPDWQNQLLVGALKFEDVRRVKIQDGQVMEEQIVFKNFGRVRDVAVGPDGAIYVVLNDPGRIARLTPATPQR